MERDVYIITPEEEICIGTVADVMRQSNKHVRAKLMLAIRDVVDGMVFNLQGNGDITSVAISIR